MEAIFSTWPFSLLQRLPRMRQVFCPAVAALDLGQVAAHYALSSSLPALEAVEIGRGISNPGENTSAGLVVVDPCRIAPLAHGPFSSVATV